MLPLRPDVPEVSPGDRITAEQQNKLIEAAVRSVASGDFFSTRHGSIILPPPPTASSGGGVQIIRFFIVSVDPYCNTCTALGYILSRPTWGQLVYGERTETFDWNGSTLEGSCVDVYDFAGCYLNEPEDDLIGRIGYASLLTGYQPTWCGIEEYQDEGAYTPKWEIISPLCCKDTNCGVVI